MKIVYVPHWLHVALRSAHAPKGTFLNVEKLLTIVSQEDVGFYIYINSRLSEILPVAIKGTFDTYGLDFMEQAVALPNDVGESLVRQWDDYDAQHRAQLSIAAGEILTCDLGDENTIVFTHVHPTMEVTRAVGINPLLWLYNRLIRQYRAFVTIGELAQTPLFYDYLKVLSTSMGVAQENRAETLEVEK